MRTLYIEGVASHGGPESCVGVLCGRSEALTGGVRAGLLSRETPLSSGCRRFSMCAEGNTAGGVIRELLAGPVRSEIPGTHDELHAREPGDLVVACEVLVMPRPGWFAGGRPALWRAAGER